MLINVIIVYNIHSSYITLPYIKIQNIKYEDTSNKCHIMVGKRKCVNSAPASSSYSAYIHNKWNPSDAK